MAEWLKALVLKTRDGDIRRFESCPFRHKNKEVPKGLIYFYDEDGFEPRFASSAKREILNPVLSATLKQLGVSTDSDLRCESCLTPN